MLDDIIREQLNNAEASLLSALRGEKDLAVYHSEWTKLLDTVSVSFAAGRLDTSIAALAQDVAMRIACIADCFVGIEQEYRSLTDGLHNRWKKILAKHYTDESKVSQEAPTTDDTSLRHPNCLAPAYEWLLVNLHNPYPNVEVKKLIASRVGCSVASISSWFINVRRRIGWTAICREHFGNCRADAVDAAYRILVKEDPSRTVSWEVAQAFSAMKMAVEDLHSSTLATNPSSVDLDEIVKDLVGGDGPHSDHNSEISNPPLRWTGDDDDPLGCPSPWSYRRTSYGPIDSPSCRFSHSPSPVPTLETSFFGESDDEEEVRPPTLAGRKRCVDSSDGSHLTDGSVSVRKRRRISATSDDNAELSLYDIAPLINTSGDEALINSSKASLHMTLMPRRSRKRRLSDAGGRSHPKRPQDVPSGPRVQAVSDPLPKSTADESSINDWFNINFPDVFEVPPPVDFDPLDSSGLWQVELFNDYRIPEAPKKLHKGNSIVTPCLPICISEPLMDAPSSEMPEFSNFLQSFDDSAYNQTFSTPNTNGSHLVSTPFSHADLSPLGVCSGPSNPTGPGDFLGSTSSQSVVTAEDYTSEAVDLPTARTPTLWVNKLSGPLQSSNIELGYLSALLDSQPFRQLSPLCM
ncbi:hypothetical protein EDD15DRAFT_2320552 [Pisolithus albus]|nr:hypothetical protein EDD15DRAFT_2320552 [Pisolithus albus]